MTDFNKIKEYYKNFDEKNRLVNDNSGKLEYEMTIKILHDNLPEQASILDLGGGAGIYSFQLAKEGYKVCLADLSDELISQAKTDDVDNTLISCDVVNATNLSIYGDSKFDVVLLFGPLYHLLDKKERINCVSEVNRVLKPNGLVFASFIPYLSGSIAILDRYFKHPEQVDVETMNQVFKTGCFKNISSSGFQEGYYPRVEEIIELFNNNGFNKRCIRSIRGFGYEKEDMIYNIKDVDMFNKIVDLINLTSDDLSIINTCGHAMYIGEKTSSI